MKVCWLAHPALQLIVAEGMFKIWGLAQRYAEVRKGLGFLKVSLCGRIPVVQLIVAEGMFKIWGQARIEREKWR